MTWEDSAACKGRSDLFFVTVPHSGRIPGNSYDAAKMLCAQCPVKADCLQAGMNEVHGVWGGLSPTERQDLRRSSGVRPERRPKPIEHGTKAGYYAEKHRGIEHCQRCREAYGAARAEERQARTPADITLHGRSGYTLGCRCDICRTSNRGGQAAWRARQRVVAS